MASLYALHATENQIGELELLTGLSFQRSYLIYSVPAGRQRGQHRHKKNHSLLFCLSGSVNVFVQSVGDEALYQLSSPNEALHLLPSDWRVLYDFSPDCIVLALATEAYSRQDYRTDPYRPIYLPTKKHPLIEAVY